MILEKALLSYCAWVSLEGMGGLGLVSFSWGFRSDALTATMLAVVTLVSACVHVYAVGYMHKDEALPRFMSYLSLFTFAMLVLVTADNLVQMFFGWEGVGLCSYLLIGYWYRRDSANKAAMKAFIVNRIGDIGFALGIFTIWLVYGSFDFGEIFTSVKTHRPQFELLGFSVPALELICILLFIGACGKSAQLGLHTWLPDAMEGPTPVSALIHAATMVTAGVFLVCRFSPLYEHADIARAQVTLVGAATAFFAATIALSQNDIKRVIAYSTCSQLGYMFFAAGVSAYQAAMFHLTTHAFFKALLFLGAGSVIHAMSDEQDMRKMGGIRSATRVTYVMMWVGSLALAGIFPLAGFWSKDIILEAAWGAHSFVGGWAFWLGLSAALMTAFYAWRVLILTFHGKPRGSEIVIAYAHESPPIMLAPLALLALGALGAGALYPLFVGSAQEAFWGRSLAETHQALEQAHHVALWVKLSPLVAGLFGIVLAYWIYQFKAERAARYVSVAPSLWKLSLNKWYFDEFYDYALVRPGWRLGSLLAYKGDPRIIDRFGAHGLASRANQLSALFKRAQSGYLYHYAFMMLAGLVLVLLLAAVR